MILFNSHYWHAYLIKFNWNYLLFGISLKVANYFKFSLVVKHPPLPPLIIQLSANFNPHNIFINSNVYGVELISGYKVGSIKDIYDVITIMMPIFFRV